MIINIIYIAAIIWSIVMFVFALRLRKSASESFICETSDCWREKMFLVKKYVWKTWTSSGEKRQSLITEQSEEFWKNTIQSLGFVLVAIGILLLIIITLFLI